MSLKQLAAIVLALAATAAQSKPPQDAAAAAPLPYPPQWDVKLRKGTELATTKARLAEAALPERDAEDRSRLPRWFRAYLREQFPKLPTSGPYQYPHEARMILDWMVEHPDPAPEAHDKGKSPFIYNVSMGDAYPNCGQWDSESSIASNPVNSNFLIAASNVYMPRGVVAQRQYFSSDRGRTWTKSYLPMKDPVIMHADPSVTYGSDETAWAATLGFKADPDWRMAAQLYRSPDRGATWEFCRNVTAWGAADNEKVWSDPDPDSPFKGKVFVVWTQKNGSGVYFAELDGCDPDAEPPAAKVLSGDNGIGAHLASGPSRSAPSEYKLYLAWPDTDSGDLKVRSYTKAAGLSSTTGKIASTAAKYQIQIPAQADRNALIYLSLAVDRSRGPNRGMVYAVWTDCESTASIDNQQRSHCSGTTNVYFSSSDHDGDVGTWTSRAVVGLNPPLADQFNPWMDVDPRDGTIHVIYYETTDDPKHKTRLRHVTSVDGGKNWTKEHAVATADTDETLPGADHAMQYGDYNGLTVAAGTAFPSWTDRRPDDAGNETREQVYTVAVSNLFDFLAWQPCWTPVVCLTPEWLAKGDFIIRCLRGPCVVLDRISKFCPECRCDPDVCPDRYELTVEGLPDDWLVDVVDSDGNRVKGRAKNVGAKRVLALDFNARELRGRSLEHYAVRFKARSGAPTVRELHLKTAFERTIQAPH